MAEAEKCITEEQPDGAMSLKSAEDKAVPTVSAKGRREPTRASKRRAGVAAEDNDDGAGCFPIATSANK